MIESATAHKPFSLFFSRFQEIKMIVVGAVGSWVNSQGEFSQRRW